MPPPYVLLVLATTLATGCSRSSEEADPVPTTPPLPRTAETVNRSPEARARHVYRTKCQVCHGASGAGDGPGAAELEPKPRSYQDSKWQQKTSDEQIRRAILEGGPAIGLSPAMPGYPALKSKPEVTEELVQIIRSFENK